MVFEVSFRMNLATIATIATIVSLFAGGSAISCNVGTNVGTCSPTDLGAAADTCFQCVTSAGLSESSGCLYSSTCGSFQKACLTDADSTFLYCRASNCNACNSSSYSDIYIQQIVFPFSSLGLPPYILSSYTGSPLLCVSRNDFKDPTLFPFGSNSFVQSVLIWNNADLFAFSSSDCSGASLQPSQIVAAPRDDGSTCFYEIRPQILAPSASVLVQAMDEDSYGGGLKSFGLSLWFISDPFPTQTCQMLPRPPKPPPPTTNALDAVGIIGIFTDYLLPLLLLAFSCRSLLLRPSGSRLTLPHFSKLWHCRSGLQDRCAAWFVTSTLIDFFFQLCFNLSALSQTAFLWNWIGVFPTSMVFRPVLACLIFLNHCRFTACVSVIEGCLMAAAAYLRLDRLKFLDPSYFPAPRIISIIPPLMFALTNVVFLAHSARSTNQHVRKSTKNQLGIRIFNAIFGDPSPTLQWHSNRVTELVQSLFRRANATDHPTSQAALITAPNFMSARMMTLLFLSAYWMIMWFGLFVSISVYIRNIAVGVETYGEWIVFACDILLIVFAVIFCVHLKDLLTNYYGRFVRMSKLCRRGLVPPRVQSATSFHFAAKHVSSEALRIMFQSVYLYLRVCWWTLVVVLLVVIGLYLSNNWPVIFGYISWFVKWLVGWFTGRFIRTIKWVVDPDFLNVCSIVLLSKLFASSWCSLFRFFAVEHPLVELPKRLASCCCLQFRCVSLSTSRVLFNLFLLASRFTSCSYFHVHTVMRLQYLAHVSCIEAPFCRCPFRGLPPLRALVPAPARPFSRASLAADSDASHSRKDTRPC